MTKSQIMGVALVLIILEAVLPVPGPLTLTMLYVLMARPGWFKTAVQVLYHG